VTPTRSAESIARGAALETLDKRPVLNPYDSEDTLAGLIANAVHIAEGVVAALREAGWLSDEVYEQVSCAWLHPVCMDDPDDAQAVCSVKPPNCPRHGEEPVPLFRKVVKP